MSPKLLVMLALIALPFAAMALLIWFGPKGSAAKAYGEAMRRRLAMADELDAVRQRVEQARQRLRRSQRELAACAGLDPDVGDPDAPAPAPLDKLDRPAGDCELDAA